MSEIDLRASSMPLAFRCAGSVRLPMLAVREESEAGNLGTALHEAIRPLVELGSIDWDGIPAVAGRYGVDFAELRMLVAVASQLWHQVKDSFPDALTEVELFHTLDERMGLVLTGHADLLSITGTVARGGDWKSGRKAADHEHQFKAYASLVLLENPELTECTWTGLWLRDGEIENFTMTRADAVAWFVRLMREVIDWDGKFRPGAHCQYCPRSHECEAANAMVRRDVAALADKALVVRAECEIELMAPAEIVALYEKASLVETYAGRVRDAVKAHVARVGDVVANGHRLTIDTETRRELDPVKAWPVLEAAGFQDEDFAASMTLGVSKVENRIREKAGKGKGASAVRALQEALTEAGAVGTKDIQKLKVKPNRA